MPSVSCKRSPNVSLIIHWLSPRRAGRSGGNSDGFMVADAVYIEPVSSVKFPANREISRENRKIRHEAPTRSAHLTQQPWAFLAIFPEKINREITHAVKLARLAVRRRH